MGGAPRADECWYERMTSVYVRNTRDHERWADYLKLDLQDFGDFQDSCDRLMLVQRTLLASVERVVRGER